VRHLLRRFFRDRSGATAIEYALLVLFLVMIIFGSLGVLGSTLSSVFAQVTGSLT